MRRRSTSRRSCSKLMPMNNATQITDAERAPLGRWYEAGAPAR